MDGRGGKIFAKILGKIAIDAFVFFLQRDCQGKYFLFCKALKAAHNFRGFQGRRGAQTQLGILLYWEK